MRYRSKIDCIVKWIAVIIAIAGAAAGIYVLVTKFMKNKKCCGEDFCSCVCFNDDDDECCCEDECCDESCCSSEACCENNSNCVADSAE